MDLNSFHPERVVFMRKEILLPAVAVAGGGAGFVLRRWELALLLGVACAALLGVWLDGA